MQRVDKCEARGLTVEDCATSRECVWTPQNECLSRVRVGDAADAVSDARHQSPARCSAGSRGAYAWNPVMRRCIPHPLRTCSLHGRDAPPDDCDRIEGCAYDERRERCAPDPRMDTAYEVFCQESAPFQPCMNDGVEACREHCLATAEARDNCGMAIDRMDYKGCVAKRSMRRVSEGVPTPTPTSPSPYPRPPVHRGTHTPAARDVSVPALTTAASSVLAAVAAFMLIAILFVRRRGRHAVHPRRKGK